MFFFLPWRVDVPQDRWPVMNWLILVALVAVFARQVADILEYRSARQDTALRDTRQAPGPTATPSPPPGGSEPPGTQDIPGLTGRLILRGWSLTGLFGHMWLHGGLFHLLGNMLFLWIFGNAVCAKIGNLPYLLLYVLLGVAAGIAHLLFSRSPVVGASGAIYGVVGVYLVLFYQNDITCVFVFWLIVPYVRVFAVSSIWIILLRLGWDVVGALTPGGPHVAYFAHFGGFAAGFGIAFLLCKEGWITMERYEKSLLQMWEERRRARTREPLDATYARLGLRVTEEGLQHEGSGPGTPPEPQGVLFSPTKIEPAPLHLGADELIRTACACGQAIRATRQYAGRTVRCPSCKRAVVIPSKTDLFGPAPPPSPTEVRMVEKAHDDFIRLVCTCGQRIKVDARYAGRTGKCPRCGSRFKVPPLST